MNAKTELLLYHMLWGAGKLLQPTMRNLEEGFEGWAYRNGLLWQIQRLEARGLLEAGSERFDGERVHRLTEAGRIAALGGRDPEPLWASEWDRKWRLFLFDIPESERSLRRRLTRSLAGLGCGCLQGSVWIAARRPAGIEAAFPEEGADCAHLMILEAESRGLRVDRRMVEAAWDFENINALWQQHMEILSQLPCRRKNGVPEALAAWAKRENAAWLVAVRADPLLPSDLNPKGYAGRRAWRMRKRRLSQAGELASRIVKGSPPPDRE